MKIPQMVSQKHKCRDSKICSLWVGNELTIEEIARRYKISTRQVSRIIYKNRAVINVDRKYAKLKRMKWLEKQIEKAGYSKKDSADLVEQLRKEFEGDKPLVDNSSHKHVTIVWNINDEDRIQSPQASRGGVDESIEV